MKFAIIPGDGIGKEVTAEAVKVIEAVGQRFGRTFDLEHLPWSADYYLQSGVTIPPNGYDLLREFDAILIGALGDPRVPDNRHARDILLGTRFELDLYVNYRPVRLLDDRLCPLKGRTRADVNFAVFRENTEGVYVGIGGRFKPGTDDEIAIQEEINTYKGVHRIIRYAFEFAKVRKLTRLCMADKSNAMTAGHALWQRVFRELAPQYPGIDSTHYYIDALAMYLVLDPGQFQVIVTNNLFGDIITDLAATFQGGLGMAASGNIHPGKTSMFEPVHGSAPKFAGKNVANPIGAIASAALMMETLGLENEAKAIDRAIAEAVNAGDCTADIGGALGTREAGDAIVRRLAPHGSRNNELTTYKDQTGAGEKGRDFS
jgi:3-isopropylmalate dehydrogenase